MFPVANLSGAYNAGAIQLKWTPPPGAPGRIYIHQIVGEGFRQIVSEEFGKHANGISLPYAASDDDGIRQVSYLVFLGAMYDRPDLNAIKSNPQCVVSVAVGRAEVKYSITEKELEAGFVRHSITVNSDSDIPSGALVYTFVQNDTRFYVPFPDLEEGKNPDCVFYTQSKRKREPSGGSRYGITVEPAPEAKSNITAALKTSPFSIFSKIFK